MAKGSTPRTVYQSGAERMLSEVTVSVMPSNLGARRWARFAYFRADLGLLEVVNLDSASALSRAASRSSRSSSPSVVVAIVGKVKMSCDLRCEGQRPRGVGVGFGF